MEGNQEGKSEKAFKSFGKKVDSFLGELEEASEKMQSEFQSKYEELKISAEKFKKEAQDKERWKEVESNLKKAGEELSKAFKSAFSKRPENEDTVK
jgi:hypothetical protein